ncbi:MAG: hypothetical protein R3B49_00475 [Phycisphaerales bacterium]
MTQRYVRARPLEDPAAAVARKQRKLQAWLATRDVPCPGCRYNLRGLASLSCPECGYGLDPDVLIPRADDVQLWRPWFLRRKGALWAFVIVHACWFVLGEVLSTPTLWFETHRGVSVVSGLCLFPSVLVFALAHYIVDDQLQFRPSDEGPNRRWTRNCWGVTAANLVTLLVGVAIVIFR